jgi:hypothetical protein
MHLDWHSSSIILRIAAGLWLTNYWENNKGGSSNHGSITINFDSSNIISLPNQLTILINVLYPCCSRNSHMSCSVLLEKEEEETYEQSLEQGVPICSANLSSPVIDQANYIDEIRYKIGNKAYIENAD